MNKFTLFIVFTILVLVATLERFRVIRDLPNYEVSNKGRIRNLRPRRLKTYVDKLGYSRINLCGKSRLVHRLVAKEWCPNPENKACVDHIDGSRLNNHIPNLRWATVAENTKKANTGTAQASTRGFETRRQVAGTHPQRTRRPV